MKSRAASSSIAVSTSSSTASARLMRTSLTSSKSTFNSGESARPRVNAIPYMYGSTILRISSHVAVRRYGQLEHLRVHTQRPLLAAVQRCLASLQATEIETIGEDDVLVRAGDIERIAAC